MTKKLSHHVLGLAGLMLSIGTAQAQEAGTNATGEELYFNYGCYQCHGYEGQGGFSGPRIGPTAFPFEAFMTIVRKPYGVMPAYSSLVLAEADLRKIYDYVASIPEPPPLEDIPALSER